MMKALSRGQVSWVTWMLLLAVVAVTVGCGREERPKTPAVEKSDGKPLIVASIFPLKDLTVQIVGDWGRVEGLMPAGSNPHHFDPTAQQTLMLNRAEVLVTVGLNLDPWAEKAFRKTSGSAKRTHLEMAKLLGIESGKACDAHGHGHAHGHAHDHGDEAVNQHLWLDLGVTKSFVQALSKELVRLYPQHQQATEKSTKALLDDLDRLDQEYQSQLAEVPVKSLVTFHNAFDELAERYGLKVVAHLSEIETTPSGEVTPEHLMQAVKAIREHQLKTIYAEPQFPSRAVEMIRQQTGATLLTLDPEGNPAIVGYGTYQEMMRSNLRTLVQGQSPPSPPSSPSSPSPSAPPKKAP